MGKSVDKFNFYLSTLTNTTTKNMNNILYLFSKDQKGENIVPIWLMRQAGRYLPEYMNTRSKHPDFMECCFNPESVEKITLQPINRFDFDAAIIFSDILTIPYLLGSTVKFLKDEGPKLQTPAQLKQENIQKIHDILGNIYQGIAATKRSLPTNKALIGFCGAPWTLMCYMYTDGSKNYANVKQMAYGDENNFYAKLEIITEAIVAHLKEQIKAGANMVQIFDSWSGLLDKYNFNKLVIEPLKYVVKQVKKEFPTVPIIIFAKDAGIKTMDLAEEVNPDAISLSYSEDLEFFAKHLPKNIVTQGNLDPIYLQIQDKGELEREVYRILNAVQGRKHIFNLGHGINPTAKIENVQKVIDLVRKYGSV